MKCSKLSNSLNCSGNVRVPQTWSDSGKAPLAEVIGVLTLKCTASTHLQGAWSVSHTNTNTATFKSTRRRTANKRNASLQSCRAVSLATMACLTALVERCSSVD